jgi:hypothetical protein
MSNFGGGVGQEAGIEIWRTETTGGKPKPVPWPVAQYGKFYVGDSYIVLNTKVKPDNTREQVRCIAALVVPHVSLSPAPHHSRGKTLSLPVNAGSGSASNLSTFACVAHSSPTRAQLNNRLLFISARE